MDANLKPSGLATRVAEIVDRERRASKISQKVLAQKMGISHRTLQRKLAGQRSFSAEEMFLAAWALGRKPESLFAEAA